MPLHLLVLMLKGWNIGLLLLTLIISGLALHGWLLIETQLNGIAFTEVVLIKFDKNNDPMKKHF